MKSWKRILVVSVTFLTAYFIYKNWSNLLQLFQVITSGIMKWITFALIAEIAAYYFLTKAHEYSLKATGIIRKDRELAKLVLASLVVNTTAPTGGATGALLFADDAKKRNESPLAAATGVFLLIVSYFVGLLGILSAVLGYLKYRGELGAGEIIASIILAIVTGLYISLFFLAHSKHASLKGFLTIINNFLYKIRKFFWKKAKYSEEWVNLTIEEVNRASKSIKENPFRIIEIISMQFVFHVFNIAALYFIFLSFGAPPKLGIIISGYAIGELFRQVSPAPEGVGVTEASMALIFSSFGIDPIDSTAIAIVYRGLNFWIPLGLGFIVFQTEHLKVED